ncbi:MAG: hypothetical protein N3D85_07450 [Candidatus Bathyarchaeota archaeon]|nr:hypothetical protein [Candidatus Bathyarchaeota archaeon]
MPFNYLIKWSRTNPEKVTVEAYHKYPQTIEEKRKPLFTIGKAKGGGLLAIRHLLEKATQKNPTKKQGNVTKIFLSETDPQAYETVYRIGLAVAMINKAKTKEEIEKATRYILNAMPEEIWFWTSKLLDDEINSKSLDALAIISGAKTLKTHKQKHHPTKPTTGEFWPKVREQMKTKATQLYRLDHPETEEEPTLKELKKAGYMKIAKKEALKELQAEKKTKKSHSPYTSSATAKQQ